MALRLQYGARRLFVHLAAVAAMMFAAPATAKDVHILAFGDSLTAGYGLPREQGFAAQLQDVLRRHGVRAFVTDAGVSGDTVAAGRRRLAWTLDGLDRKPDLAIVALGGNDMLRGLPPAQMRVELDAIVAELKRREVPVLLAGMMASPNLGAPYGAEFNAIYPELARKYDAVLYPFFLANVAGDPALNLPDLVHPNFQGIKKMVSGITPYVLEALGAR
jgi:acyl-CoA thioesterase I